MYRDIFEEELIHLTKQNDHIAYEKLEKKYINLIRKKIADNASIFKYVRIDRDDVFQYVRYSFYKAVQVYDESRSSFYSYIYSCIVNAIKTYLKNNTRNGAYNKICSCSLDEVISLENSYTYHDVISNRAYSSEVNPDYAYRVKETEEKYNTYFNEILTPLQRKILVMRISGHRYNDIAQVLSISSKEVDNNIQAIRRRFKKFFHNRAEVKSNRN